MPKSLDPRDLDGRREGRSRRDANMLQRRLERKLQEAEAKFEAKEDAHAAALDRQRPLPVSVNAPNSGESWLYTLAAGAIVGVIFSAGYEHVVSKLFFFAVGFGSTAPFILFLHRVTGPERLRYVVEANLPGRGREFLIVLLLATGIGFVAFHTSRGVPDARPEAHLVLPVAVAIVIFAIGFLILFQNGRRRLEAETWLRDQLMLDRLRNEKEAAAAQLERARAKFEAEGQGR